MSRRKSPTTGQRRRRAAGVVVVAVAALMAVACADEAPTKPQAVQSTAAPGSGAAVSLSTAAGGALIGDARGRLAASIADANARAKLQGYLDALSASLDAGDTEKARHQIGLARKLIAAHVRTEDAADLAAIGLALDQVETQLTDASAPAQP
jgi:hypothetical protein